MDILHCVIWVYFPKGVVLFDTVDAGRTVTRSLRCLNAGQSPLRLTGLGPAPAGYDPRLFQLHIGKAYLGPGEETTVRLIIATRYFTGSPGLLRATLDLRTENGGCPDFYVSGWVRKASAVPGLQAGKAVR